jgi:hypothetical protein
MITAYLIFGLILSIITLIQEIRGESRAYNIRKEQCLHDYYTYNSHKCSLEAYMDDDSDGKFFSPNQQLDQYGFQKHNWISSLLFSIGVLIFGTLTWPIWVIAVFIKGGHNII